MVIAAQQVVHVDSTAGLVIVNEGETFALEKIPFSDIWAGCVDLRAGDCYIAAITAGSASDEPEPVYRFHVADHADHAAPPAAGDRRARPIIRDLLESDNDLEQNDAD